MTSLLQFIAIPQCICITNMLQALMCTYSMLPNEALKNAGKRKRSTLHHCRAFRPSCPTGFGGGFFVCFISVWASRALAEPLRWGVASEGSWGGPRGPFWGSFLTSFLGSFWTQLELSSHVFDYMTLEWLNELTQPWIMDFLHVSHLRFHIFCIFSLVALTILHCPVCRRGGLADDGKRASHARDVR